MHQISLRSGMYTIPEDMYIPINDLAISLATKFRYAGQDDLYITVAGHCIQTWKLCAEVYPNNYKLQMFCLLHDIEEALTGDIVTGIKSYLDEQLNRSFKPELEHLRGMLIFNLTGLSYTNEQEQQIDDFDSISAFIEAKAMSNVGLIKWYQDHEYHLTLARYPELMTLAAEEVDLLKETTTKDKAWYTAFKCKDAFVSIFNQLMAKIYESKQVGQQPT